MAALEPATPRPSPAQPASPDAVPPEENPPGLWATALDPPAAFELLGIVFAAPPVDEPELILPPAAAVAVIEVAPPVLLDAVLLDVVHCEEPP